MYKTGKGLIAPSFRHFSLPLREDAKFRLHSDIHHVRIIRINKNLGIKRKRKGESRVN